MLKKLTVALIKWYRKELSPRKRRPSCRFYPTCSAYALTAVEEWGTVRGLILSAKRIARCHPYGGQGIDPVPVCHRKKRAPVEISDQQRQGQAILALCLETRQEQETK